MATINVWGYPQGGALAPQQEQSWWTGPLPASFVGTVQVMAHAWIGPGAQYTQALAVTFVQMTVNEFGQHYAEYVIKNVHTTHVAAYTIWVTTIGA